MWRSPSCYCQTGGAWSAQLADHMSNMVGTEAYHLPAISGAGRGGWVSFLPVAWGGKGLLRWMTSPQRFHEIHEMIFSYYYLQYLIFNSILSWVFNRYFQEVIMCIPKRLSCVLSQWVSLSIVILTRLWRKMKNISIISFLLYIFT